MKYLRVKPDEVFLGIRDGAPVYMSTTEVVRAAVNDCGQGIKLDELRSRNRVLDVVEKPVNGFVAFEDADAKTLQRCVKSANWTRVQSDLEACLDAIEQMPSALPAAATV